MRQSKASSHPTLLTTLSTTCSWHLKFGFSYLLKSIKKCPVGQLVCRLVCHNLLKGREVVRGKGALVFYYSCDISNFLISAFYNQRLPSHIKNKVCICRSFYCSWNCAISNRSMVRLFSQIRENKCRGFGRQRSLAISSDHMLLNQSA